ncbi:transcriptional regulator, PadR-like family [Ktedonobacter racemifer DSM 44963]|uniref:Transcriptional regulator, PadR-like family n=1 Tax=Ktedonobacter racemifer DSM 44963 TaxID=485913 RepID=D6TYF0_KTERA|nr:transcriptional regulator, PadR-like family [Ktedonobacter racemifer DSM 44963]
MTTLGYALLALLARQESSGYDLAQRLKRPIGFFWTAHSSHIYSELARLEEGGFITPQVVAQPTRPAKRLFSVTESGLAALRTWVTTPIEPSPPRDELVLKAYAIWLADPAQAIALFRQQEELHTARLAEYEHILARIEHEHGKQLDITLPDFGNYATLHAGVYAEQASVAWCRWMVEQLTNHSRQEAEQG